MDVSYPLISTRKCVYQGVRNTRFRKIWCVLFSCYFRFKIHPFGLSPTTCFFYIFGHPVMAKRVRPSIFFYLLLRIYAFFVIYGIVLNVHVSWCIKEPDFIGRIPLGQKWPGMVKNSPKMVFLNCFERLCH